MSKDLTETMALNLVKNAITHNEQSGEIITGLASSYFAIENTSDIAIIPANNLFK